MQLRMVDLVYLYPYKHDLLRNEFKKNYYDLK